jgi:hypothetical protein
VKAAPLALVAWLAAPALAGTDTLHAIQGCVLETHQPIKGKVVQITYLDLRKVLEVHVLGTAGEVEDGAPMTVTPIGAPTNPYRVEPGQFKTPEVIQTFIRCNQ